MANEAAIAALMQDSMSPLTSAGIDPDEALQDRRGTMARLLGSDDPPPSEWQQAVAAGAAGANAGTGSGRYSPNGNELPAGLKTRANPTDAPDASYAPRTSGSSTTPPPVTGPTDDAGPAATPATSPTPSASRGFPYLDDVQPVGATPPPPSPAARSWGGGGITPKNGAPSTFTPVQSLDRYTRAGFEGQLANLGRGDTTVQQMASEPSEQDVVRPLLDKIDRASVPVNPNQKGSNVPGHFQENYRPTWGQRLMRAPAAFARGGVLGLLDPTAVGAKGYNAPNGNYDAEVARRAAVVASTQDRLKTTLEASRDRWAQYKERAAADQAQAGGYAKVPDEAATVARVGVDQQNADSSTQNANTRQTEVGYQAPPVKLAATEAEHDANYARGKARGLKGLALSTYALTGSLPTPDHYHAPPVPAEQQRYNTLEAGWQAQNPGKRPPVEKVREWSAAVRGEDVGDSASSQQGDDQVSAIVADATAKKQAWADQYDRNPGDGSYTHRNTGATITPGQFQDSMDKFRADANVKLARKGATIDAQGNVVAMPGRSVPSAPPALSAPASGPIVGSSRADGVMPGLEDEPSPGPGAPPARTPAPHPRAAAAGPQPAMPPASLLRKTPEGGFVHGRNGEVFQKRGGRWIAQ